MTDHEARELIRTALDQTLVVEQPLGLALGEHAEDRIDARLDRPLAQQVGAEPVNRADMRLFEVAYRFAEVTRHGSVGRRAALFFQPLAQAELQLAGGGRLRPV